MAEEKTFNIEVRCPFCPYTLRRDAVPDSAFDAEHVALKGQQGDHILFAHREKFYEVMCMMQGPFFDFVRAQVDATRRMGQALTPLQRASKLVNDRDGADRPPA